MLTTYKFFKFSVLKGTKQEFPIAELMYFTSHTPFFINQLQANISSETCVTSLYGQSYFVSQNVKFLLCSILFHHQVMSAICSFAFLWRGNIFFSFIHNKYLKVM